MAKKATKLFPTPENCQKSCMPGTAEGAAGWFTYINGLLAKLTPAERADAQVFITAERGIEVWFWREVPDAELNLAQETLLFNAIMTTPVEKMTEDWRKALIAQYHAIDQGDQPPVSG